MVFDDAMAVNDMLTVNAMMTFIDTMTFDDTIHLLLTSVGESGWVLDSRHGIVSDIFSWFHFFLVSFMSFLLLFILA